MTDFKRSKYTQDRLDELRQGAVSELAVCLAIVGAAAIALLVVVQLL